MRILEVTHYMPPHSGGIERVVDSIVEGLGARGHDLHWIASADPAAPASDDRSTRVPAFNMAERVLGVPYPLWGPGALRILRERVAWADVVHAHDCLYIGTTASVRACGALRKPLLITQHVGHVPFGPVLDVVQRAAYGSLGRRNLLRADRLVACSPHVAHFFQRSGVDREFHIIPNAVGVERYAPPDAETRAAARRRLALDDASRVLLFVGRLVPKKAVPRVLAVHRALSGDGSRLLVVGAGPLAGLVEGVPGVSHFPQVSPSDMPAFYAAADVFILPSRGEGLPVSVQEAMLSGLPVVVSDDPAFTSNLAGGPGVTIARDDTELVMGARAVLRQRPEAARIASWARARWSGARFLDAYERALDELAGLARVP